MNRRPPHEPTRVFHPSQRLHDDASRHARWLGCLGCPDFKYCQGLHTEASIFDCNDLCSCEDRTKCDMVCRNKPEEFFERLMEVDGFDLATVPRVAPVALAALPDFVPLIGHKYSRTKKLVEPVVAVPLYELFHMGTGEPHVRTRSELAERFRISTDTKVVVTGVDRDAKVEAWWAFADRERAIQTLRNLGIALVTAPNYSLFTNVPRPDNLHGMKRIALSWAEVMGLGVAAALHLNARTDHDYARWTKFVAERPEVTMVAFEFATGAGYSERLEWHVDRLCALATAAGHELTLIVRGGVRAITRLQANFRQVILIETDPFSRALKRRRAMITESGRLRWTRMLTPKGESIDDLLAHNIITVRTARTQHGQLSRPARLPIRRPAKHTDRQPDQLSLVPELDATLQGRAMPANRKRVVATAKA